MVNPKKVSPTKLGQDTRKANLNISVDGILGLISFSSIIPIKRMVPIEKMSGSVILWPYIGIIIGGVAAVVAYILTSLLALPQLLTAAIVYAFILWFTGFNHIDGVIDMGDGLMVHGDHKKRLSVMRDSMVGTGGITAFFIIGLLTVVSLSEIPVAMFIASIVLMEICAKLGMITTMCFGTSDTHGIGHEIKKGVDAKVLMPTIVVILVIGYLLLNVSGVMAVAATVIVGLLVSYVAQKNFGCVTGDALGASNEISRLITLLFILINLHIII